jgi:hypothetical protein
MAKPRNTKIMIYVAHTESKTRLPRNSNACDDRLTGPSAQLKSCLDQHPLAQAGARNHSLVFGPAIVRKSRSSLHLCSAGDTVARTVNRLWYGRALVALRTYPQWTLRSAAIEQCLQEEGDACPIKLGNPVQ